MILTIDRVRSILAADPEIKGAFASYKGEAAVFMRDQAPLDTDPDWSPERQYPRADLAVTTQYLPDRVMEGQFAVSLWAKSKDIDASLRRIILVLDGAVVLSDEGRDGLQWMGTTEFDIDDVDLAHCVIMFTISRIPTTLTWEPDPVARLNEWTATAFEDVLVNPQDWLPLRDKQPAVFWRMTAEGGLNYEQVMSLMSADFVCHVIHKDPNVRFATTRKIVHGLALIQGQRISLGSKKPILLLDENAIRYDSNRDPLRVGQVALTGVQFRIPRAEISIPRLEDMTYVASFGG